jgi:hypothetical protein
MSVQEFSRARRTSDWPTRFTRWRGLLSLVLGLVLGPVLVLAGQQAIYSGTPWVCGHGMRATLHLVPALTILVLAALAFDAHRNWRSVGGGVEEEHADIATRTRFTAMLGMAITAFSALVMFAQWLALFMFEPCLRV